MFWKGWLLKNKRVLFAKHTQVIVGELKHAWNAMVASSFWDMRLNIACAATDAESQNRIILHDNTLNLPVVARQPHPDPNYALHSAVRRVAAA